MPKVDHLVRLLQSISTTTRERLHIDIEYDGKEFHWEVSQHNITADQFCPRNPVAPSPVLGEGVGAIHVEDPACGKSPSTRKEHHGT